MKKSKHKVKFSGRVRKSATGARRDAQRGKGRFDLLPFRALWRLAKHYENGAAVHGERDWEKGMPLSWFVDSGARHLAGRMIRLSDEDHLAAVCWNFLGMLDTEERIKAGELPAKLDDLPQPIPARRKRKGKRNGNGS